MTNRLFLLAGLFPMEALKAKSALADMVPPTEFLVGASVVALAVCGLFAAIVVSISVAVIRAVKKNRAPKDLA